MNYYIAALGAAAALCAGTSAIAGSAAQATTATATPATPAAAATRYAQAPAGNSLLFSFVQAGAANQGEFKKFATELVYDEHNPGGSSLKVTVQTASFDTQDKDRNETLAGADLLDPKKFPTAQFIAGSLAKGAKGLEAVGKLTLHGVTRDLRLPLELRPTATGLTLSGATTIKRLDYGIGTGDWASTEWVGDEIKLSYQVALVRAAK
jgi:polyisoprenoid-binding protein YceI